MLVQTAGPGHFHLVIWVRVGAYKTPSPIIRVSVWVPGGCTCTCARAFCKVKLKDITCADKFFAGRVNIFRLGSGVKLEARGSAPWLRRGGRDLRGKKSEGLNCSTPSARFTAGNQVSQLTLFNAHQHYSLLHRPHIHPLLSRPHNIGKVKKNVV